MSDTPNPGSDEALARGCTCAVLDNAHGRGVMRDGRRVWWMHADCLLHGEVVRYEARCRLEREREEAGDERR